MSSPSVQGRSCIFDGEVSTRRGEHTIPHAVISQLFPTTPSGDPNQWYSATQGGEVLRKRQDVDRPKVPCCEACNRKLNERFEVPAQDSVLELWRAAFGGPPSAGCGIGAADRRAVSLWFLKSILLTAHPERIEFFDGLIDHFRLQRDSTDPVVWQWIATGGVPPSDLHLWVTTTRRVDAVDTHGMSLYEFEADGVIRRQQVLEIEIAGLSFVLLYLPGGIPRLGHDWPGVQLWPAVEGDVMWRDLAGPAASFIHLATGISRIVTDPDPFSRPFDVPRAPNDNPGGTSLVSGVT